MYYSNWSRRQFLRGAGGFLLALPFLPSLSFAIPATRKRFIGLFHANGIVPEMWYPAESATKVLAPNVRELLLTNLSGSVSDTFNSRYDQYKSKMLILRGLDCIQRSLLGDFAIGHGTNHMLGGQMITDGGGHTVREGNKTVDQVLAESSKIYPTPPVYRSLVVSGQGSSTGPSISYASSGGKIVSIPGVGNPLVLFNQLFKDLSDQSGNVDKSKLQNKLAVDMVIEDFKSLSQSRRISSLDRKTLESHIESLYEVENRLRSMSDVLCTPPSKPDSFDTVFSELDNIIDAQMKNIAVAIKCGLTSIATLAFTGYSDNTYYNSAISGLPNKHHHDMAHEDHKEGLQILRRFWAKHVATLIDQLDVVEDQNTGATFLDNSLIYWGSENTEGYSHAKVDLPVVIFGSAGGFLKTGRLIDYRDLSKPTSNSGYTGYPSPKRYFHGRPYNELLVTILQAMGLSPEDYETGGEPGYGDYSYDEPNAKASASQLEPFRLELGDRQSVLPFIKG